jgi:hypothetical protein
MVGFKTEIQNQALNKDPLEWFKDTFEDSGTIKNGK